MLILLGFCLALSTAGCRYNAPLPMDSAVYLDYTNELDDTVTITYRYDGGAEFFPGGTIRPRSRDTHPVMVRSSGLTVRGITKSGEMVLDRHVLWVDVPKGGRLPIAIGS